MRAELVLYSQQHHTKFWLQAFAFAYSAECICIAAFVAIIHSIMNICMNRRCDSGWVCKTQQLAWPFQMTITLDSRLSNILRCAAVSGQTLLQPHSYYRISQPATTEQKQRVSVNTTLIVALVCNTKLLFVINQGNSTSMPELVNPWAPGFRRASRQQTIQSGAHIILYIWCTVSYLRCVEVCGFRGHGAESVVPTLLLENQRYGP